MSVLISAFDLSKSFGAQTLFKNLTFAMNQGQKIGLIGPNGAGKSTLLKILARLETPDRGEVSFARGLKVGYLEQDPKFKTGDTVFEVLRKAMPDPDDYEQMGFVWELISRLELDSPEAGVERPVSELSGGWMKRVALAQVLAPQPQILLFDEPTNHLDVESIEWLETFLGQQRDMGHLMITHDRLFLQNTCDFIFDLDPRNPKGLIQIEGTYADFLVLKEAELGAQKTLEQVRKNQLRQETYWLRRGAKARQTKQTARIDRAHELADTVDELIEKNRERKMSFEMADEIRNPKKIVEAKSISQERNGKVLVKDFSFILGARARVGIMGPNGCGKSTLIQTLLGKLEPTAGTVMVNEKVQFALFDQKKNTLKLNESVLKNICPEGDYVHVQGRAVFARSYLARFHFRNDQMELPVTKLSGGEKTRLLLAQLLLQNEPVFVLDEPTNDLDIATMDTLQEALAEFPGALILVTHDRYFMDQVCNEILVFTGEGHIQKFANLFQWEEWRKQNKGKAVAPEKVETAAPAPLPSVPEKKKPRLGNKEQREWDQMESNIAKAEAEVAETEGLLASPEVQANYVKLQELATELEKQKKAVERLYARWDELSSKQ
ncbi:MAG: ABC-F family ATP-binding cassette domain-containing protein [Bdellovibrionaceae bacterium]|nr:ABC-F family ATP-binding cassette domain-containing protein [Pseudobdellovibrionaceae bacterium]